MKTWKYQKNKVPERFHAAPPRPDKALDLNRCDKCGTQTEAGLRPHKGQHICLNCKIKLL